MLRFHLESGNGCFVESSCQPKFGLLNWHFAVALKMQEKVLGQFWGIPGVSVEHIPPKVGDGYVKGLYIHVGDYGVIMTYFFA